MSAGTREYFEHTSPPWLRVGSSIAPFQVTRSLSRLVVALCCVCVALCHIYKHKRGIRRTRGCEREDPRAFQRVDKRCFFLEVLTTL